MSLKTSKKMLQDKLAQMTGKAVTLKGLTNLSSSIQAESTRNNIQPCAHKLIDIYSMSMNYTCLFCTILFTDSYDYNFNFQILALMQ